MVPICTFMLVRCQSLNGILKVILTLLHRCCLDGRGLERPFIEFCEEGDRLCPNLSNYGCGLSDLGAGLGF